MNPFPWLVADIGGTNSRFALITGGDADAGFRLSSMRLFANADFGSFEEVLEAYLADLGGRRPQCACLAVAGPVDGERVRLTNIDWAFSVDELRRRQRFARIAVMNDFAALACSAPLLRDADLATLKPGRIDRHAAKAIIGPGTGFGAAALVWTGERWQPLPGEGGHAAFAPTTAEEMEILRRLSPQLGHVSVESLLCGRGLVTLYRTLADDRRQPAPFTEPAQITAAALNRSDDLSENALRVFAGMLASTAGDLALTYGARGGVYLGGGIAQSIRPYLEQPWFIDRFLNKGPMQGYLQDVPLYMISHEQPALLGAAAWLECGAGDSPPAVVEGVA